MIDVFHWLCSFVVLSVALAQLESIQLTSPGLRRMFTRAGGWCLIGLDSFAGVLEPFTGHFCPADKLGMIGLAFLAISYQWQGATKHVRDR